MVHFLSLLRPDGVRLAPRSAFAAPQAVPEPRPDETPHDWFLTASQRGNTATRVRPWTEGNVTRALVDGETYFRAVAEVLARAADDDLVLFAGWRVDPDEKLGDDGPTVAEAVSGAVRRGAQVKALLWRSHLDRLQLSRSQHRYLSRGVNALGGEILLDQRVRLVGSHHQKFLVVRHATGPQEDVAFLGGLDLAHGRRDDVGHDGDPQGLPLSRWYGDRPAWHDVQVALHGPAVADVENAFRERWDDPAPLTRLPWQVIGDRIRGGHQVAGPLPAPRPAPASAGTCAVQLLRTYPHRRPGYPFAPRGERSAARGYAKAMRRARRLVYLEDQYLWSLDVARVFADALRREPGLHLVAVVPRYPDQDDELGQRSVRLGHSLAMEMVHEAGGDRVLMLDVENAEGKPVYVHAKVSVVDDVWATVGSDNFNRRSWTHDSELTAAIVDEEQDLRVPLDPGGLGDGARVFARDLRLRLWREHLELDADDALLDPDEAVETVRRSAAALDAWHTSGRQGPRPPGRLREHLVEPLPRWERWVGSPVYRTFLDPDGRSPWMRLHGHH